MHTPFFLVSWTLFSTSYCIICYIKKYSNTYITSIYIKKLNNQKKNNKLFPEKSKKHSFFFAHRKTKVCPICLNYIQKKPLRRFTVRAVLSYLVAGAGFEPTTFGL